MKLSWFVSINLMILVALVHVYHWAKFTYDEKDILNAKVHELSSKLKQSQLKIAVAEDRFMSFRQEIAMTLPDLLKTKPQGELGYQLRSIASVTQKPDSSLKENHQSLMANLKFESARKSFQEKKFTEATRLLKQFIDQFGFSSHAPDAYFLLVESLYQEGKTEEAVQTIHKIVDMFPGHEVTGFSMIRLGKIMESNGRAMDAIEVYKTVIRTFPYREVASQAKSSLAGVSY